MKKLSSVLKSIVYLFSALILLLSFLSYTPRDIAFLSSPAAETPHNIIGIAGAHLAFFFFFLLGYAAYFLPFYFLFAGLERLRVLRFSGLGESRTVNGIAFALLVVLLSAFLGIFSPGGHARYEASGIIGFYLAGFFRQYLGFYGALISLTLFLSVTSLLLFGFFFVDIWGYLREGGQRLREWWEERNERRTQAAHSARSLKKKAPIFTKKAKSEKKKPEIKVYQPAGGLRSEQSEDVPVPAVEPAPKAETSTPQENPTPFDPKTYRLPAPGMLKVPPQLDYREVKEDIESNISNLEETLSEFGVEAKVVSVQKGPVVTMYELEPSSGVKIQKISALADDIALAMKSSSVRVVAPLPGRGTVGVEIPNEKKHFVYLREVIEDKRFTQASSKLSLGIGKNVSGSPVVADLKEMPHLLIAGATGSGKTICVNSLISSILFKARPDQVKFILIDPKMVELTPYSGIPHLLHPIICDAKKAVAALSWAVEEMERRYRVLASEGTRNIDALNKRKGGMPYIVVVVDELADLMIVARDQIEISIQRLAQLSRAVGIHLILATQRPSVDVITGVIKANFPARISFKVSSKVDSRTVLDAMGADKLLGKGDLLFLQPGAMKLTRAQGSFIDDEDIETLTNFLRSQGGPVYEEGIQESEKRKTKSVEGDEMFDDAVKVVLQARQASASILQRRLRVGYTRAARLIDLMEEAGIVGPFCGSKAREILVEPEEYIEEKGLV
ncbi:MAG: DUF87 domain-containing protein [Candidatus Omnitrophica bacterium]|nr:DUF87 domain-containing protein [Candidatus Omnitrophota bacterium]